MSTYRYHSQVLLPSGRYAKIFLGPFKVAVTGAGYYCVRIDDNRPFCLFQKGDDYYSGKSEPVPGAPMALAYQPSIGAMRATFEGVRNAQSLSGPVGATAPERLREAVRTLIAIGRPDAAKHLRRYLTLSLHPDRGGRTDLMTDFNALLDTLEQASQPGVAA